MCFPVPTDKAVDLLRYCTAENKKISEIVYENEKSMRSPEVIDHELMRIWDTMLECMYIGCHTEGILPGGLNVRRRAFDMQI
jgi:L-serine dehydratase